MRASTADKSSKLKACANYPIGALMSRLNKHRQHLHEVCESYFKHAQAALTLAWYCLIAAFALLLHALLPGYFVATGSAWVERAHAFLTARKARLSNPELKDV